MMRFNDIGQKDAVLRWLGFRELRVYPDGTPPTGPSGESRRLWRNREVDPGQPKISEMLKALAEEELILSLEECSDGTDVALFMDIVCAKLEKLGKTSRTPAERYKFLSTLWAMDNKIGSAFIIPNKKDYTDHNIEAKWCGLFCITRNTPSKISQEMRMAITHVSHISNKQHEKTRFLNCMLTIKSKTNERLYQYRGYLSFENFSVITWLFYQESTLDPDMLILMTDKGALDFNRSLSGHGLTASEGPPYRTVGFKMEISLVRKFDTLDDSELDIVKSFLNADDKIDYFRSLPAKTASLSAPRLKVLTSQRDQGEGKVRARSVR